MDPTWQQSCTNFHFSVLKSANDDGFEDFVEGAEVEVIQSGELKVPTRIGEIVFAHR